VALGDCTYLEWCPDAGAERIHNRRISQSPCAVIVGLVSTQSMGACEASTMRIQNRLRPYQHVREPAGWINGAGLEGAKHGTPWRPKNCYTAPELDANPLWMYQNVLPEDRYNHVQGCRPPE
jgi:hypothetical protein